MSHPLATLVELQAEATRFVGELALGERATLVTLSGELGAGKTAFVQAVARALGVEETVTSPTFVLEKIYLLPAFKGHLVSLKRLVHIDAYRLKSGADLAPLGFDDLMKDEGNLILLEWPERVADALPAPVVRVTLTAEADGAHTIAYG